jgi:formate hydrogenlyase subunit 6/NADH:ubiquinone oxidoreductase subunit I
VKTPCIVCQENCPVTPKAIYITEVFETVRGGGRHVQSVQGNDIRVEGAAMAPGQYATGDFYVAVPGAGGDTRYRISSNEETVLTTSSESAPSVSAGDGIEIQVCLHQPNIDLSQCIGCGTCVHECPVGGTRAIRVTSDNESRSMKKVAA